MKPEFNSKRLFGITRSKGKMYELDIPENLHISIPEQSNPEELLVLTIGILGDAVAFICDNATTKLPERFISNLLFSASFFDAFIESKLNSNIDYDLLLIASSTYYLAGRPGSSLVIAKRLYEYAPDYTVSSLQNFLKWLLQSNWKNYVHHDNEYYCNNTNKISKLLAFHFFNGENVSEINEELIKLRNKVYSNGSAIELLYTDITIAIVKLRLAYSSWNTLPEFSNIQKEVWQDIIKKPHFPKELWPSQLKIGEQGLFSGSSGVIQMPTSAGKTKSVEIILRSSFLSYKTKLAIVVAPFRALCHEIAQTLKIAFKGDGVRINELSDVLQLDFMIEFAEIIDNPDSFISNSILVLTPEKLLYLLRQKSNIANHIGTIIYDEGHQFDSGSRGITYELLLTEIKKILPPDAQTILISAVINNAKDIASWLISNDATVVDGQHLLATSRAVSFASWLEIRGQLIFYENQDYNNYDYFLPRILEQQNLTLFKGERSPRVFPSREDPTEIGVYLGCRLVPNGSVAIFSGRKDSAYIVIKKMVDIYKRDFVLRPPADFSNLEEINKLHALICGNFGQKSILSEASLLGVFLHHGTTPNGLRLAIEFAMQKNLINFVSCTSTLAQGVNLPIRYLIVPSVYQAGTKIKVRDFQNLIGRAGRSGMHTEGLIIFSDPSIFDKKNQESYKFNGAVNLLNPENTENITSSLLSIFQPIVITIGFQTIELEFPDELLLVDSKRCIDWAETKSKEFSNITPEYFLDDLRRRKNLTTAIESYLMANRGNGDFSTFLLSVITLSESTLAFHLADDLLKSRIINLFTSLAKFIEEKEPIKENHLIFSKTLLGIDSSQAIYTWVHENYDKLINIKNNFDWLTMIWNILLQQIDDPFLHLAIPNHFPINLAKKWIDGESYEELINFSIAKSAKKPYGSKYRKVKEDDIYNFCENTLGFHGSLIISAVGLFLFGDNFTSDNEQALSLLLFQKSLKYGLPDLQSISCYEFGFSDRFLAQELCDKLLFEGFFEDEFYKATQIYSDTIKKVLLSYPSYFSTILSE
ncbi:DEAD/DEAH box helicase [Acinetobacter silvestris]|nr:DEAD/DEAH box helicase [Acinetobacter silvestris]